MLSHLTPTAAETFTADAVEAAHTGQSFVMMDSLRVYYLTYPGGLEIGDVYRPIGSRFQPVFITAPQDELANDFVLGEFDDAVTGKPADGALYAVAAAYDVMMQDSEIGALSAAYGC